MRKIWFVALLCGAFAFCGRVAAQQDNYLLNHLAVGAEVGTTGVGLEIAAPLTHYVTFRTGMTMMPSFSYKDDVSYTLNGLRNSVRVKGTTNIRDWKLLADIYPFRNRAFHLTGGFYIGKSKFIDLKNTEPIVGNMVPGVDGIEIGDRLVTTDDAGIAKVNVNVKSFKPYVGIGFGRAVSQHRVNVAFDMGVQFWNTPSVKAYVPYADSWETVNASDDLGDDINKVLDKVSDLKVYPVLSLRIYCRLF